MYETFSVYFFLWCDCNWTPCFSFSCLIICVLGLFVRISLQGDVADLQDDVSVISEQLVVEIHGSGTTNPSKLHWNYMSLFHARLKVPTHMTYRAVGSSTGRAEFIAGVNDFGCSEVPMSASDVAGMEDGAEVLHFPLVLGAVGVFHNVPSSTLASDLELTPNV